MKTLLAVLKDFKIFFNPKTKFGRKRAIGALLLVVAIFLGFKFFGGTGTGDEVPAAAVTEVFVVSVGELGAQASFDTVGKVEAVSEANLQAESGGRITSVSVKVGDSVSPGKVLATIENSSQRAVLVQSQGAYEAAVAAANQNEDQTAVSLDEANIALASARSAAANTVRQSYTTANNVFFTNIDNFFGNANGPTPGVKIDSLSYTSFLNNERVAFQTILPEWQSRSAAVTANSNLESEISYAKRNVERTISLVDIFITIFNQGGNVGGYTEAELQANSVTFTALKSSLIATRGSLDAALTNITAAKEGIERAKIGSTRGVDPAAAAQIKIALGSYQAAQANYQKTIVRSPIQGVVNAFYLKTGDYTSPGQPAGIVANNNGLQIKTFVSEVDSANLNVGDTVTIEGGASGVITAKAAALDPNNGKVAIVVGVNPDSGLTNGATVSLTFSQISEETASDNRIIVPLSALKITSTGTFVFTVGEESTLVPVAITQGQLYGENIEILSGVTKDTRIVTDARGLKEGQEVIVK